MLRSFPAAILLSSLLVPGCGDAQASERITIDDLPEASEDARGVWESQPWSSDAWLEYPGSATLVIRHDLGRTPRAVLIYLSFESTGENAALAAGDLARVIAIDDDTVSIENHTKSDFFARIVLE